MKLMAKSSFNPKKILPGKFVMNTVYVFRGNRGFYLKRYSIVYNPWFINVTLVAVNSEVVVALFIVVEEILKSEVVDADIVAPSFVIFFTIRWGRLLITCTGITDSWSILSVSSVFIFSWGLDRINVSKIRANLYLIRKGLVKTHRKFLSESEN